MWPYFGGKFGLAHRYPRPRYPLIIEPFAGAAGYSRYHAEGHRVMLLDLDPVLIAVWHWLQRSSIRNITDLPILKPGQEIPDDVPLEAQWFLGWSYNHGSERPRNFAGKFGYAHGLPQSFWRVWPRIKEWTIRHAAYDEAPNVEATWFIDPPYQSFGAGSRYRYGAIDYDHLRSWAMTRKGQVIVCEGNGADWLPFRPLHREKSQRHGGNTRRIVDRWEMVWHRRKS